MGLRCEKSLVPGMCKEPVIEQCVYCGKHFCAKHGHTDKAVCKSWFCVKKYERDHAIAERIAWEEEQHVIGRERNAQGSCGKPGCPNQVYITCGHCEVGYCPEHVTRHSYSFRTHTRRATTRIKRDITICEVCLPHLEEYKHDVYE